MKQIDENALKDICYEILKKLDSFCKKNNLDYFLAGGTLLGAVRHHDYIPWDDDIDVLMPRPSYDKMLELAPSFEYFGLKLYNLLNMEKPYFAYSKLADVSTIQIENIRIPNNLGINIDIFPVDGVPSDCEIRKKHFRKLNSLKNKITLKTLKINKGKHFYSFFAKMLVLPLCRPFINLNKTVFSLDKLARRYDYATSTHVAAQTLNYGLKEIVPKEYFEEVVYLKFRDSFFPCMKHYHEYLTQLFGDYMSLPPKEQQVSHHSFEAYYIDRLDENK